MMMMIKGHVVHFLKYIWLKKNQKLKNLRLGQTEDVYFSVSKDRAQILQPQPPRCWYHRHMQSLSAPKPFLIEIHPPAIQNKLEAMAEPGVLW